MVLAPAAPESGCALGMGGKQLGSEPKDSGLEQVRLETYSDCSDGSNPHREEAGHCWGTPDGCLGLRRGSDRSLLLESSCLL